MKCVRADKIARSHRITDDIRNNIKNARIVVADLTDSNPNVFYEVGMAHAFDKRIILVAQTETSVPFNLRDVRFLQYDPHDLTSLRTRFLDYVSNAISTIPSDWNRNFQPPDWKGAYIKLTSVEAPSTVQLGQPFRIMLTARNNGRDAHEGYFSVSFPDGVDSLAITSNVSTKIGKKGDSWASGRVVLSYQIAEGFLYSDEHPVWQSGKEYSLAVEGYAKRKGLLWYYVNASSYDAELDERRWDPDTFILDRDQRDENVYCGVIEVIDRN